MHYHIQLQQAFKLINSNSLSIFCFLVHHHVMTTNCFLSSYPIILIILVIFIFFFLTSVTKASHKELNRALVLPWSCCHLEQASALPQKETRAHTVVTG